MTTSIDKRIIAYAKAMNISEEDAKKKFEENYDTESEEENSFNDLSFAVDDQQGSLEALEHSATLAKTRVINGTKKRLKGVTLNVSKEGSFSYKLSGNTLTITGKNCVVDIDEITNHKLNIVLKGSGVVLNSNVKVNKITNSASNSVINGSDGNDNIVNNAKNVVINSGKGNDIIKNTKDNVMIDAGAGNDAIENSGDNSYVFGSEGSDNISNTGYYTYVDAGEDNDIITNKGSYSTVHGNTGNDNIKNTASGSKVYGNAGKDTIINSGNYSVIYGNTEIDNISNSSKTTVLRDALDEEVANNKGLRFSNGLCYQNGKLYTGTSELLGNSTDLDNDGKSDGYVNGFEALKALALKYNLICAEDDVLDKADLWYLENVAELKMKNGYLGKSYSFSELGITEIRLPSTTETELQENFDEQGNALMTQRGAVFVIRGEEKQYADIWHKKY